MKKIILSILSLFLISFTSINASNKNEISVRHIVSNMVFVEEEDQLISNVVKDSKPLYSGETLELLTPEEVGEVPFSQASKYGHTFYKIEVIYEDGSFLESFSRNHTYESISELSEKDIDELVVHYSYAAKHNISYKLNDEFGEDLKDSVSILQRTSYNYTSGNTIKSFVGDVFNLYSEIDGYQVKEVIGSLSDSYDYDEYNTIIIYEKVVSKDDSTDTNVPPEEIPDKDNIKPVEPSKPDEEPNINTKPVEPSKPDEEPNINTKPVEPNIPIENPNTDIKPLDPIVPDLKPSIPKEEILVKDETVLPSESTNTSGNSIVSNTVNTGLGYNNAYYGTIIVISIIILSIQAKKKRS